MTSSPVERHGAGIKGMDQLSTVTTRTQLQRVHIRSQSQRVMLSPPPQISQTHTQRKRVHREVHTHAEKHTYARGVKTFNLYILAFDITNVIRVGVLV